MEDAFGEVTPAQTRNEQIVSNSRYQPAEGTRLRSGDAVSTGTRVLLPDELRELHQRSARALYAGCALLLPVPFLFLGFLIALAMYSEPDGTLAPGGVGAMVLMLVTLPALLVQGRHYAQRGLGFRNDARQGVVHRFEVTGQSDISGTLEWFEVLPASRLVWTSSSPLAASGVEASYAEVADPSAYAATAAEWTSPLEGGPETGIHVNQRVLTNAEREEVRRHALRAALRPLVPAVPLTLWMGSVLYLAVQAGHFPSGYRLGSFLLLCLVTMLANLRLAGGLIQGWRLWQDRQHGRVLIVRLPGEIESGKSRASELSPPREFLPFSRRHWTISGTPSAWRAR